MRYALPSTVKLYIDHDHGQVESALRCWPTGEWAKSGKKDEFSWDNWADIPNTKDARRATNFLPTLNAWSDEKWAAYIEKATEWKEPRSRRSHKSSRASSVSSSSAPGSDAALVEDFIIEDE